MRGVLFDLDGVLVDSEKAWDEVRRSVVAGHGGAWRDGATRAMLGMSTPEWSEYLATELGTRLPPERIAQVVTDGMVHRYAAGPPLLPGAVDTVRTIGQRLPVAIASSSPPVLIDSFLTSTGLGDVVRVALSSEQAGAGKPEPDVYLLAAERLGVPAAECAAVEDSTNGLRAALAAGATVYAVPNPHFPPDEAVLARVERVLSGVGELPAALGIVES